MTRVRWKWLLPVAQLALALTCHVYGPHEYRAALQRERAVNDPAYYGQNYPAPAERISHVINFPALTLVYPLTEFDHPVLKRNTEYTLIWVTPHDLGFFVGIVLFWYLIGKRLDDRARPSEGSKWPRKMRIAGLLCGCLFGILTGAYAVQMIASTLRPERQIGATGIAWGVALFSYFGWQLTRESYQGRSTRAHMI